MINTFAKAYEDGLKAARDANYNLNEINKVFTALDEEIFTLSDKKISIQRIDDTSFQARPQEQLEQIASGLRAALQPLHPSQPNKIRPMNQVIAVQNIETKKVIRIATCRIAEKGYPVRIIWANRESSCEDEEALIDTLQELLSDPHTGKIFLQLLDDQIVEA